MKRKPPYRIGLSLDAGELLNFRQWPGYAGAFTRDQSPLAEIPNDARVVKIVSNDSTDIHQTGALGTVLGSFGHPDVGVAYFVEFDDMPGRAIMIHSHKIKRHG